MYNLAPTLMRINTKRGETYIDPVAKQAGNSGSTVLNFTCATANNKDGEPGAWFDCAIWGPKAQELSGHLKHNDYFILSGKVTLEKSEKNGAVYNKLVVNTDGPFYRVGRMALVPAGASSDAQTDITAAAAAAAAAAAPEDYDDIPF